jgi:hypothetical protein
MLVGAAAQVRVYMTYPDFECLLSLRMFPRLP